MKHLISPKKGNTLNPPPESPLRCFQKPSAVFSKRPLRCLKPGFSSFPLPGKCFGTSFETFFDPSARCNSGAAGPEPFTAAGPKPSTVLETRFFKFAIAWEMLWTNLKHVSLLLPAAAGPKPSTVLETRFFKFAIAWEMLWTTLKHVSLLLPVVTPATCRSARERAYSRERFRCARQRLRCNSGAAGLEPFTVAGPKPSTVLETRFFKFAIAWEMLWTTLKHVSLLLPVVTPATCRSAGERAYSRARFRGARHRLRRVVHSSQNPS